MVVLKIFEEYFVQHYWYHRNRNFMPILNLLFFLLQVVCNPREVTTKV